MASLPIPRTSQLEDVTEVDNRIRQLAPVLDAVELPFQGNGLQNKVGAGAIFGEWIVPKRNNLTGVDNNNASKAMGVFAGRSYQKITQQEKPDFMTRATYVVVLLHNPWAAAKMMDIPGSTLRNRVESYPKKVIEMAKQTSLPNLLLRLILTPAETAYLDASMSENCTKQKPSKDSQVDERIHPHGR